MFSGTGALSAIPRERVKDGSSGMEKTAAQRTHATVMILNAYIKTNHVYFQNDRTMG